MRLFVTRKTALQPLLWACALMLVLSGHAFARSAEAVTEGSLTAIGPEGEPLGPCPLKHTNVDASIVGFLARVTVTQAFENPYETPIEAVYTFPLSEKGAVDSMEMRIGDRVIRGVIKEKDEAREIYEAAKAAGQHASLLDQERPNIFTQSVANIMPGESIDITISYVEYLDYDDGEYTFSFPMVVGPRYIPGTPTGPSQPTQLGRRAGPDATGQTPDAGKINPPITPEGARAGHDISLTVHLDAGVPLISIDSELHEVHVDRLGGAAARVALQNQAEIPNRDFVLRYKVAGEDIGDALLLHEDERGAFFTLIMQPPERVEASEVTPRELYFVVDSSGSMNGFPIEKAKHVMRQCIEQLGPQDTFNLMSFAGHVTTCFEHPVPNTEANRQQALNYLQNLQGSGGTEMMAAIKAALGHGRNADAQRLRVVCFMTDGYVGNDMAILGAIQQAPPNTRVFSFGIGNSVNRFLLENMAVEGRGAAEIVTLESESQAAADRFWQRVQSPILTDIGLTATGIELEETYPRTGAIPDLFAATPLIVTGRIAAGSEGALTVTGNTPAGAFSREIAVDTTNLTEGYGVLATLWARKRVDFLMRKDWQGIQSGKPADRIKDDILELGLGYNLLTQYTSFVAVEEKVVNEGGVTKTVEVPVEMPDGVSYEGVFGDEYAQRTTIGAGASGMALQSATQSSARVANAARGSAKPAPLPTPPPPPMPQTPSERDAAEAEVAGDGISRNESEDAQVEDWMAKLDVGVQALATGKEHDAAAADGKARLVIELTADGEAELAALRALGVDIVSHARSGKRLLARVPIGQLEQLAKKPFVKAIRLP